LSPKAIDPETLRAAEFKMWCEELEALDENGRPDWAKRRIAGMRVCELSGISGAIKAISAGGELDLPPAWPEVRAVPLGGGPGFLRIEVATHHEQLGVLRVPMTLRVAGRKEGYADQANEAIERGRWTLRKMIEAR
jgi:hypothetical protein